MEQKVTFTQEEQKFFTGDNNYIEYFFEVGIKPSIFSDTSLTPDLNLEQINSKIYPEIISKFPYFDKKSMTIDSTIIDFIFPKEYKAIQNKSNPNPEFYSIILDNPFYSSDYSYKYIGCLLIYESLNTYKKIYDAYSEDSNSKQDKNKSRDDFKNIYVPKCLCLASVHPNINKFEIILRSIYDLVLKGKNYFIDEIIEKLICQTPKVPRGVKKVYIKLDDKNIDLTETKLNELSTINVDLKTIFSSFKIEKIVEIYKLLLFETKTIFFCSQITEITNYILCFLLLLKPFTYQFRILSILPKKFYYFLDDNNPCIFGVNELYTQNFFQQNKLILGNLPICIVDLDKKDFYILNKNENIPPIPSHLKDKLDKRTEEYRKSKKKTGDKNEDYQEIFYRFMINLFKDYPKYLKKNSCESNKFEDMFDKQGYLNSQSSKEKEFYNKIISSQMFLDLIIKRLMPRDTKEKIQALFFEEKLNVKKASKKKIRGNKILEQNVLLPSNDFDYVIDPEIVDLTKNKKFSLLNVDTKKFFYKENINKEVCLPRGYIIKEGKSKSELYFEYYIFPELLSETLFKYNCNNYSIPSNYSYIITTISEQILKNCFIEFDDNSKGKSSEYLNDIYISYVILFALSLSYMDKEERKPRFNNLLQILTKIDNHDMEVLELLFNSLIKLKEEEMAVQLYTMFNQLHINLTWSIFLIMSKILHKGQNVYSAMMKEMKFSRGSSVKLTSRNVQNTTRHGENKFRKRSIKLPGLDDNILGEEIFFDVFGVCLSCKNNSINLEKICEELSPNELNKNNNRFKCKCGDWNIQKLNFKIGTELYNKNLTSNHSSLKEGVILYSPTNLKKKLLNILSSSNEKKFELNNFRMKYPEEFWNSVWYFKLKEIDISFMLPYTSPVYLCKYGNEKNLSNFAKFSMEEQRESRIFTMVNNEIKNPNIKIRKLHYQYIKFNHDILCKQNVYQIAIFKIVGMIVYKIPDSYRGNISIKGNILKGAYSKKVIKKKLENKNKLKNKDSILFSNNLITSEFDLTTSTSTAHLDKNEEISNKLKEVYNAYENEIISRKTKVGLSNGELFDNIREDDENYYKFKEYKEDDSDNF